jgi:hypothetical protein
MNKLLDFPTLQSALPTLPLVAQPPSFANPATVG